MKKFGAITISVVWDVFRGLGSQLIALFTSIILARHILPETFGLVAMAIVGVAIAEFLIDAGLSTALIKKGSLENDDLNSVFWFNITVGLLLSIIFAASSDIIESFYSVQGISRLVLFLSPVFLFKAFAVVQQSILQVKLDFRTLSLGVLLAGVGSSSIAILLALYGFKEEALIAHHLLNSFLTMMFFWVFSSWKPRFSFSVKSFKQLWKFGGYLFYTQAVNSVSARVDIVLISKAFSPNLLGLFTRATSLRDQFGKLSADSLNRVFYPVLSKLSNDFEAFQNMYFKVLSLTAFLGYLIAGVLYIASHDMFLLLYGENWIQSALLFKILIIGFCNLPINMLMINALLSSGHSKTHFKLAIAKKSVRLSALFISVILLELHEVVLVLSVVSYILTVLNVYVLEKVVGISAWLQLKKAFVGILPLLLLVVLDYLYFNLTGSMTLITLVLFIVAYFVFHWVTDSSGFRVFREKFNEFFSIGNSVW